jgi:uncharacterized protein (TIGR00297 family)
VHIGVGAIALSLKFLTWPQAAAMAVAAVLFNLFVLPRLTDRVFRPGDRDRLWSTGIVLYPLAVLGLILVFRERLDLAAAAWGILAAGDGMATLIGTTVRSPRLPWNPEKSIAGLLAFICAGALAAVGLLVWTSGEPLSSAVIVTGVVAAVVAGFAETIPITLDDNLTVPVAAGAALWSCSLFDPAVFLSVWPSRQSLVLTGLAANVAVAVLGWMARTVTIPGAITGAVIGMTVVAGFGWPGWLLLLATFGLASATTRIGHARKQSAGIAESRGGRRGPGNAIANTGIAAWAAVMAMGLREPAAAGVIATAALATAGSDTVASEIGKAYGRTTWLVTTFRRVAPGTTGALSTEGTLAGIAAAAFLAAVASALGLIPPWTIGVVTVAATIASLIEGALGATLEARGILNNDSLNFVNAAIGAALAVAAWCWWLS